MPVLKGSVTFTRFKVEQKGERPRDVKRWLSRGFKSHAFEPLDKDSEEDVSAGWVELEDVDKVDLAPSSLMYGEYVLVSYRIDKLRVPGATVRAELESWGNTFEASNGRPPRRAERAEQRELIVKKLRRRAIPISKTHDVSWNLTTGHLQIWTTARGIIDEIQTTLEKQFELRLEPLAPGAFAAALGLTPEAEALLSPTTELLGSAALGGE